MSKVQSFTWEIQRLSFKDSFYSNQYFWICEIMYFNVNTHSDGATDNYKYLQSFIATCTVLYERPKKNHEALKTFSKHQTLFSLCKTLFVQNPTHLFLWCVYIVYYCIT